MNQKQMIIASYVDLAEDFDILTYLTSDLVNKTVKINRDLTKNRLFINKSGYQINQDFLNQLNPRIKSLQKDIQVAACQIRTDNTDLNILNKLIAQKYDFYSQIRALTSFIAASAVDTDWQSPSFDHSIFSMAGRLEGKITGNSNDYKRDQHEDAHFYERKFVKEYVDQPLKIGIGAYATSSGMAAFSTILNFLTMEKRVKKIVAGKSVYFEALTLLKSLFGPNCILADDNDTDALIKVIKNCKPDAVFLDTISNTETINVPDITTIISQTPKNIIWVIDNTVTGCKFQPFRQLITTEQIIIYESLNKYHQFGMDRVTGGIIYGKCRNFEKMYDFRDHSGTNIPDANIWSIPTPNRKQMDVRLNRLSRNAVFLTDSLNGKSDTIKCSVNYPLINNHPNYEIAYKYGFGGPYLTLTFADRFRTVPYYKKTLVSLLKNFKIRNVQVVFGTSFALPVTRIYLTAIKSDVAEPFIRISPGTETLYEIEKIASVIHNTLSRK